MNAEQLLFSQGFGTRSDCRQIILTGNFAMGGDVISDPFAGVEAENGTVFSVRGELWPYYEKAVIVLNKPPHYECSAKPHSHPSVLSLIPSPLRRRGVQPIGRLDEDTTGLLLLSDDGALNHRLTHPKKKVAKVYEVTLKYPADEKLRQTLLSGVVLNDAPEKLAASDCRIISENVITLTIAQGKYHQVKRMVAAASNRVAALKRIQFGRLLLPENLKEGEWSWLPSPDLI
jgi:16S rRNA pseudouridine516 synthase